MNVGTVAAGRIGLHVYIKQTFTVKSEEWKEREKMDLIFGPAEVYNIIYNYTAGHA